MLAGPGGGRLARGSTAAVCRTARRPAMRGPSGDSTRG
jgi:hypothetical protein